MKPGLSQARTLIERATSIVVLTHLRPDGDGLGSLLALTLGLDSMGKLATPVLVDDLPERFHDLPGVERIKSAVPSSADLLIMVDCSSMDRTGVAPQDLPRRPDINFDHHPTNSYFADLNFVDPEAAATAEIIYDAAPSLGLPLEPEVASNLLVALVSDTLGFRTQNVSPKTLRMAADLMELGVQMAPLYEKALLQNSFAGLRYWGPGLLRMKNDGDLVWTTLTARDREESGYSTPDDADLINLLGSIKDVEVVVVLVEQPGGKVKVSWRALRGLNVALVAESFGGGGHEAAAGAMLTGELDDVESRVLSATRRQLGLHSGQGTASAAQQASLR